MARANQTRATRNAEAAEAHRRLITESKQLCAKVKQQCAHLEWLVDDIKRRWKPGFFQPLQDAIHAMHGCRSEHQTSFAVRKVAAKTVVWEGIVEEFRLIGHREAEACYAWHYTEDGKRRSFSLLKLAPVLSPQVAVQMALAARKRRARPEAGETVGTPLV